MASVVLVTPNPDPTTEMLQKVRGSHSFILGSLIPKTLLKKQRCNCYSTTLSYLKRQILTRSQTFFLWDLMICTKLPLIPCVFEIKILLQHLHLNKFSIHVFLFVPAKLITSRILETSFSILSTNVKTLHTLFLPS